MCTPAPARCGRRSAEPGRAPIHPFIAPFKTAELRAGFAVAGGLALAWLLVARRRQLPVIGGPLAIAFAIAGGTTVSHLPSGLVAGLLLLAVFGALARRWQWAPPVMAVASLPGAWVLATHAGLPTAAWQQVSVVLVTSVGGALLADFDVRHPGLAPTLLAIASAGVYVIVPDTQWALALLGAAIGVIVMGWPLGRASVGPGGPLVCGLLAWVVIADGYPRPGAVVAALASLGVMAAEPLARAIRPARRPKAISALLLLAQVVAVAVLHTAGHRHQAGPVVAEALALILVLAVSLALLSTVTDGARARLGT